MNEKISHGGGCRTAPATPGLLNTSTSASFRNISHTKDIHKFILLIFLLKEFKIMIFYMACHLKFIIFFFLAQVTLETSQVYYDNWYHDFLGLLPTSITFKTIAH